MKNFTIIIVTFLCLPLFDIVKLPGDDLPAREEQIISNTLSQNKGNELEIIAFIKRKGKANSMFGASVAGIGDINQDGFDDVIISNGYKGAGEALILFGGTQMDSIPDIILSGEYDGDGFGKTVAPGGDINGDGFSDFLIAAPDYPHRKGKGRVYVYFGGSVLDTIPDAIFTGEERDINWGANNFGYFLTAGDLNGDKCSDVLVSAPNYSTYMGIGKTYLFWGGKSLDSIPDWTNQADSNRIYFGRVMAIGDVNGDGRNDILMNTIHDINELGNDVLVYTEIFLNSAILDTIVDLSLVNSGPGIMSNSYLLCDDINLDGSDDFIIRMDNKNDFYHWIYFGGVGPDTVPDAYLVPWYGASINRIASAGDVNGDGWPDILAGFYHQFFKTASCGIYLGGEQINPTVDWTIGGAGVSLAGAGDVNGDGYDDIIVGMYSSEFTTVSWGAVWILAGRPDLVDIGTAIQKDELPGRPHHFEIFQNYPNPFNPQTAIRYQIPVECQVTLKVFNLRGERVRTLVNGFQTAQFYEILWDGKNELGQSVAAGIYICQLQAGEYQKSIRLVLVR